MEHGVFGNCRPFWTSQSHSYPYNHWNLSLCGNGSIYSSIYVQHLPLSWRKLSLCLFEVSLSKVIAKISCLAKFGYSTRSPSQLLPCFNQPFRGVEGFMYGISRSRKSAPTVTNCIITEWIHRTHRRIIVVKTSLSLQLPEIILRSEAWIAVPEVRNCCLYASLLNCSVFDAK